MSPSPSRKDPGSFCTPPVVVRALVSRAMRGDLRGHVLDPVCGDGRFLAGLENAVGVDVDPVAAARASRRVGSEIATADFFAWAPHTTHRFAAAVVNPPFIRMELRVGYRALFYPEAPQRRTASGTPHRRTHPIAKADA